jgi:hypothetical protein
LKNDQPDKDGRRKNGKLDNFLVLEAPQQLPVVFTPERKREIATCKKRAK